MRCRPSYGSSLAASAALALAALAAAASADVREITAARVTTPPVIDGRLDDPCWEEAFPSGDFTNLRGNVGPATQATVVRICYDASTLYVAFDCLEARVADISAAIAQRDAEDIAEEDDCVSIAIDTFRDKRTCYSFLVSPIATKRDLHTSECGLSVDIGWDAVWDVETAVLADRWTAELAIPFSAIRFSGEDEPLWGVNFARVEMPHQEYSRWSGTEGSFLDPRSFGLLRGLSGIERSLGLELLPFLVAKYDTSGLYDYPLEPDDAEWDVHPDAGLDVEYAPAPFATVNLTLNPDFAQIEADPNEINIEGDEIWLEERRPFFSENASIYDMPLNLLYTRRMEDIEVGGKVTGKVGPASLAALYVRSDDLPRDEYGEALVDSSGEELPPETSDYGALVYRQDLFGSVTAGAFWATRERGDGSSSVGALTAGFSPLASVRLNAIAARAYGSGDDEDNAFALEWAYSSPNTDSEGSLSYVGEDFAPETGFIEADQRGTYGGEGHLWKRFSTDAGWIEEYELCGWAGGYDAEDGPVQTYWAGGEAAVQLPIGLALGVEYNASYDVVDYKEFPRASLLNVYLYTGVQSWSGIVASCEFGEYHNSDYLQAHLGARVQPVDRLTLVGDVSGVALREYEDLDWWVGELRTDYYFSPTLFVRALALGEHVRELVDGSDAESESLDLNLLCGWEFRPGSTLYLAYNDSYEREGDEDRHLDPTAVLKISYLLSL